MRRYPKEQREKECAQHKANMEAKRAFLRKRLADELRRQENIQRAGPEEKKGV